MATDLEVHRTGPEFVDSDGLGSPSYGAGVCRWRRTWKSIVRGWSLSVATDLEVHRTGPEFVDSDGLGSPSYGAEFVGGDGLGSPSYGAGVCRWRRTWKSIVRGRSLSAATDLEVHRTGPEFVGGDGLGSPSYGGSPSCGFSCVSRDLRVFRRSAAARGHPAPLLFQLNSKAPTSDSSSKV